MFKPGVGYGFGRLVHVSGMSWVIFWSCVGHVLDSFSVCLMIDWHVLGMCGASIFNAFVGNVLYHSRA